jgi:hypothetical protein
MTAQKHDQKKAPMELLPTAGLVEIARVLDFGRHKYAAWNWADGMAWSRLIGATMRHLSAFNAGEDKDPESGLSHLAHAGCNLMFLLQYINSNLGQDDRYKFVREANANSRDA